MIAAGKQGSTGGRTYGSRMEVVESQAVLRKIIHCRRFHKAAECGAHSEAGVVQNDPDDVGGAEPGYGIVSRIIGLCVLNCLAYLSVERRVGTVLRLDRGGS